MSNFSKIVVYIFVWFMSFYHETQSTQTDGSKTLTNKMIKNSAQFYSKRINVQLIKEKLFELVPDDEYWNTFTDFIYGCCSKSRFNEVTNLYLRTNESKLLHNDLLRGIVFNSHYSVISPPGVSVTRKPKIPRVHQKLQCSNILTKKIEPLTIAELRFLPTIDQLSERIRYILLNNYSGDIKIENSSLHLIYQELTNFIVYVLKKAIEISVKDYMKPEDILLSAEKITHVLQNDSNTNEIISPKTYEKITVISSFSSQS